MTQTMDSATAELRRRANRVTARWDSAENTTGSGQHALAEELLRAVLEARQRKLAVDYWEHDVSGGAIRN